MGHKISVPLSSLTSQELGELVLELGSKYQEVSNSIKTGGLDGAFVSSLEKDDLNDQFIKDLDEHLKPLFRKNLLQKLKGLLEIPLIDKHDEEAMNSNVQVPIFMDFGESRGKIKNIMVDPQSDTVKSLKQKLITLGLGVKLEDIRSLSFGGRVLEDFYALKQYNIEEGTTISVTLEEEKQECRICHEGQSRERPLISPCSCKGSIGLVHRACLDQWLSRSPNETCEMCKTKYTLGPQQQPQPQPQQPQQVQYQQRLQQQQQEYEEMQRQEQQLLQQQEQLQRLQQQQQQQQHRNQTTKSVTGTQSTAVMSPPPQHQPVVHPMTSSSEPNRKEKAPQQAPPSAAQMPRGPPLPLISPAPASAPSTGSRVSDDKDLPVDVSSLMDMFQQVDPRHLAHALRVAGGDCDRAVDWILTSNLIDGGSTTTTSSTSSSSSSSSQSKQVMQPRTNSGKTASAVSSDPKPTSSPANASSKLMSMLKGPRTPTGRANAPCRHHQLRLSNLDHPKIRLFLR